MTSISSLEVALLILIDVSNWLKLNKLSTIAFISAAFLPLLIFTVVNLPTTLPDF